MKRNVSQDSRILLSLAEISKVGALLLSEAMASHVKLAWLYFVYVLSSAITTAIWQVGEAGTPARFVPHLREYFYVGGEYITTGIRTTGMKNQMYVEKLSPHERQHHGKDGSNQNRSRSPPYPIVLIHGKGMTGTNWLNTPDGRPGWASYFLASGYTVYIVDQPTRGRSGWLPGDFQMLTFSTELISQRFTATQNHGLWPQSKLHTQWPGPGTLGDPAYDAFYASTVQFLSNDTEAQVKSTRAGAALLDKIGPAILLTHSQGGLYGWTIADSRPELVKAIIAVEPSGPPFREAVFATTPARAWGPCDIPITYEPFLRSPDLLRTVTIPSTGADRLGCVLQAEPAARLPDLRGIPVLLEVGEASYHALYEHCTLEFFRQAGLERVELLRLEDAGLRGNGHLQMLELNNWEIARVLERWAASAVSTNSST